MTHARLTRGERGIGIEVEVGTQDLGEVAIDNDGTVHLGELEQAVRGKRNVEREAVVTGGEHVFGVADADKGAQVTGNDHVEGGADRLTGAVRRMACSIRFCSSFLSKASLPSYTLHKRQ